MATSPSSRFLLPSFLALLLVFFTADAAARALVQSSPSNSKHSSVTVTFVLEKHINYGEGFILTGNTTQFGHWDPYEGFPLQWNTGDIWTVTVDMVSNFALEFKVVKVVSKTLQVLEWMPGNNRVFKVPSRWSYYTLHLDWEQLALGAVLSDAI